jgi:hypothetical protein
MSNALPKPLISTVGNPVFKWYSNWQQEVLWFSRRYAFFSAPVVGATALVLSLYAVLGLLIARLTEGNWRTALLFFALAPCGVAAIVLRLRLLG